ncbi:hypothetical protein HBI56_062750 [Parastagonospora nodorum]|nr:hypothetical protein HBH53_195110 [Parastagonospora nodorum]KAH4924631.1 hypothetical protein HBI79_159300 [Parastagonospora nodorum]KAH5063110.1 hypothetical protein HBH96_060220 [Parastagonospora nodorum]KAH5429539.1 hypothetical protein HBI32_072120 [Parastagonospora nodorum]KAH5509083.1 hypothetical protein HBI52_136620 [Parastagonospora nodorum]
MLSNTSPPPSPTTSPKRVRFNPIVYEIEPVHFIIVNNPFDDENSSESEDEEPHFSATSHYETITSSSSSHLQDDHFSDELLPSLVYSHDAPSAANLQHSIQNAYDELMDITAELFPSSARSKGLGERCNVFPSEIWRRPAWRDGAVTARGMRAEDDVEDLD